jgi:hypothetical protein
MAGATRPPIAKLNGGSIPRNETERVESSKSSLMKGIIGESEETAVRRFSAIRSNPASARTLPASGRAFIT